MAGRVYLFTVDEVSADRLWAAVLQTIGQSGYTLLYSDPIAGVLAGMV